MLAVLTGPLPAKQSELLTLPSLKSCAEGWPSADQNLIGAPGHLGAAQVEVGALRLTLPCADGKPYSASASASAGPPGRADDAAGACREAVLEVTDMRLAGCGTAAGPMAGGAGESRQVVTSYGFLTVRSWGILHPQGPESLTHVLELVREIQQLDRSWS